MINKTSPEADKQRVKDFDAKDLGLHMRESMDRIMKYIMREQGNLLSLARQNPYQDDILLGVETHVDEIAVTLFFFKENGGFCYGFAQMQVPVTESASIYMKLVIGTIPELVIDVPTTDSKEVS